MRIDSIIVLLDAMIIQFGCSQGLALLRSRALRLQFALLRTEQTSSVTALGFGDSATRQISASCGRPRIIVNIDQVELLRSAGYKWDDVADAFLVSRSTIWRRLRNQESASRDTLTSLTMDLLEAFGSDIHIVVRVLYRVFY